VRAIGSAEVSQWGGGAFQGPFAVATETGFNSDGDAAIFDVAHRGLCAASAGWSKAGSGIEVWRIEEGLGQM